MKDKIRVLREAKGMTQTELAVALGLDQTTISAWERGVAEPTVFNLRRLAGVLGVSPADLL